MKAVLHLHREQRGTRVRLDSTANSEDADVKKTLQQNQRVKLLKASRKICFFHALYSLAIEMANAFHSRLGSGLIFDSECDTDCACTICWGYREIIIPMYHK